jgi:predicted AlkP superfamily pyrophosphatase or phosphodiesterase
MFARERTNGRKIVWMSGVRYLLLIWVTFIIGSALSGCMWGEGAPEREPGLSAEWDYSSHEFGAELGEETLDVGYGDQLDGEYAVDPERKITEEQPLPEKRKKVIMVMVDSMMGSLVDEVVEKDTMPALSFLVENGQYEKELIAPFPSMSVTIESTLLTGSTVDTHRVPGLSWYDATEDRMVNYGSSIMAMYLSGLGRSVADALSGLNKEHLSPDVSTIHEDLHTYGLTSGSVNMLVYRGPFAHQLHFPGALNEVLRLPDTIDVPGPDVFVFGRLQKPQALHGWQAADSLFNNYGLNDRFSMQAFRSIVESGEQPDFLLIYLPDMDQTIHEHSPHYVRGFEEVDRHLQTMLDAYPSWEQALEENVFILFGDHGQSAMVEDENRASIDIKKLFYDEQATELGEPVSNGDISFGVNQRMAYVYDVQQRGKLGQWAERAVLDDRVGLAAWLDGDWINVRTLDHNELRFKKGGEWTDRYGHSWAIEGDAEALGLKMDDASKTVQYSIYPDGLEQLYGALHSHNPQPLVLSAEPGYSFEAEGISVHPGGGDHGGLHREDTLAALNKAGTDEKPEELRMSDLKCYVLKLLDCPCNAG